MRKIMWLLLACEKCKSLSLGASCVPRLYLYYEEHMIKCRIFIDRWYELGQPFFFLSYSLVSFSMKEKKIRMKTKLECIIMGEKKLWWEYIIIFVKCCSFSFSFRCLFRCMHDTKHNKKINRKEEKKRWHRAVHLYQKNDQEARRRWKNIFWINLEYEVA